MQKRTILFFSRGRGHGHAITDMAIASALQESHSETKVRFVSYSTGAETLRQCGCDVIDINLPDNNSFLSTLYKAQSLIACLKPTLVFAHEEFAAIPAAKICNIKSVFISAWLPHPGNINAECLADATKVILLSRPGMFSPSHPQMPRPHCIGNIQRKYAYSLKDRLRARRELNIAENARVIMVASGGWASEARAPIADLVLEAFKALPNLPKLLIWMAGADQLLLQTMTGEQPEVRVFGFCTPIERWMVASDLIVTKATRGLTLDAAQLGIRSISLSHGLNPIDDLLISDINTNLTLNCKAIDSASLKDIFAQELSINKSLSLPVTTHAIANLIHIVDTLYSNSVI